MKYCPLCENRYTDETLRFCLQDGTTLDDVKQSSIDTVAFTHLNTVEKILQTEELRVKIPGNTENWYAQPLDKTVVQTMDKKAKPLSLLKFAPLAILLVLCAVGTFGWFYFNNPNEVQTAKVNLLSPANAEKKSPANTALLSSDSLIERTNQPQNNSQTSTNINADQVKKEIADFLNIWKDLAEARNTADYTSKYAETVDYYDKDGMSIKEIRSDIQKIFTTYSDIDVVLSNIRIAVDADASKATAIFDKEWSYEFGKDLLESKAHTKMQFQKNGNDWKIISEKNLKVYYSEK